MGTYWMGPIKNNNDSKLFFSTHLVGPINKNNSKLLVDKVLRAAHDLKTSFQPDPKVPFPIEIWKLGLCLEVKNFQIPFPLIRKENQIVESCHWIYNWFLIYEESMYNSWRKEKRKRGKKMGVIYSSYRKKIHTIMKKKKGGGGGRKRKFKQRRSH